MEFVTFLCGVAIALNKTIEKLEMCGHVRSIFFAIYSARCRKPGWTSRLRPRQRLRRAADAYRLVLCAARRLRQQIDLCWASPCVDRAPPSASPNRQREDCLPSQFGIATISGTARWQTFSVCKTIPSFASLRISAIEIRKPMYSTSRQLSLEPRRDTSELP